MGNKEQIDKATLPRHVAVIMDGNGRWAQQRGLQRILGHRSGVKAVRETTEAAAELGIAYLTLYAFSTENWKRPKDEVDGLMELLVDTIEKETPTLKKNNVRLLTIGDLQRLPQITRERLQRCIDDTADNTGLSLVLALSYSSRWELTHAMRSMAAEVAGGTLGVDEIDEKCIAAHLATADIPDPDLLIRTSGELRISNFLLWQLAYTELYFTDVNWPDFGKEDFYRAISSYRQRERRYGRTAQQLNDEE